MREGIRHFFSKNRFRKEISIVILVKLILLIALWSLSFSHPLSRYLNREKLADHYLVQEQYTG